MKPQMILRNANLSPEQIQQMTLLGRTLDITLKTGVPIDGLAEFLLQQGLQLVMVKNLMEKQSPENIRNDAREFLSEHLELCLSEGYEFTAEKYQFTPIKE